MLGQLAGDLAERDLAAERVGRLPAPVGIGDAPEEVRGLLAEGAVLA